MLNDILKLRTFYGLVLLLVPVYTWSKFFRVWLRLKKNSKAYKLFYSRHNCVVMHDSERGITGWPNTFIPMNKPLNIYDPIKYFISTAQNTLDIAVMVISNSRIANVLVEAHKRGISVRVLLDHKYSRNTVSRDLQKSGVQVMYYVCPEEPHSSIMHYKYMLKDYSNGSGFVHIGSQNWTNVGFHEYYENTVFTTNRDVVEAIHTNFEQTWSYVENLSKTNSYVKAKLKGIC